MSQERLLENERWRPGQSNIDGDNETRALEKQCCVCCCRVSTVGALAICALITFLNILTIAVCIYLVTNSSAKDESFNMIFIATINSVMLVSNYTLLHGSCTHKRNYIMSWVFVYGALLFLQNVVGIAAFIVAVVNKASAWYIILFVTMVSLDIIYSYCMIGVCNFCRRLESYEEIP